MVPDLRKSGIEHIATVAVNKIASGRERWEEQHLRTFIGIIHGTTLASC